MTACDYSADEMMTVTAARQLRDQAVCFVGIGLAENKMRSRKKGKKRKIKN